MTRILIALFVPLASAILGCAAPDAQRTPGQVATATPSIGSNTPSSQNRLARQFCADYRVFSSYSSGDCGLGGLIVSEAEHMRLQDKNFSHTNFSKYQPTYCAVYEFYSAYKLRAGLRCYDEDTEIDKPEFDRISNMTIQFCRERDSGGVYKTSTSCGYGDEPISTGAYRNDIPHKKFIECKEARSENTYLSVGQCLRGDQLVKSPVPNPVAFCKRNRSNDLFVSDWGGCPMSSYRFAKAVYEQMKLALIRIQKDPN